MSTAPPSNDSREMTERVRPSEDVRLDVVTRSEEVGDVENQMNGGEDGERSSLLGEPGAGQMAQQENLAEMEIQSILWMKEPQNKKYLEAYETWQAKDVLFASRVDRKRKQSNSLKNEIYQLIGYYLVFQGVLMTAVAQSNLLTCHNWWAAFFLSLLANVVTVGGVVQKFISVKDLEKTIASESFSRQLCIKRVRTLIQKREDFNFQLDATEDQRQSPASETKRWWSAVSVTVILLIFSALFLVSVRQILCDPGLSAPSPAAPG